MKLTKYCILLIAGLQIACQQVERETISNADFPVQKELKAHPVAMDYIISPDFIIKRGDFLIVSSSLTDTMLYVLELPTFRCVNKLGIQGGGPDDFFAFPMFCETFPSDQLLVWGYTPVTIKKFDVDTTGRLLPDGEHRLRFYEAFNNMTVVNDSLLLYFLPDRLKVKKYDLKQGEVLDELELEKEDHGESYFYKNRGIMAAGNSQIVYAYLYKKQIDLYDMGSFRLIKELAGTGRYASPVVGDFQGVQHYIHVVPGNNYFYALYKGERTGTDGNAAEVLEVYDYEGNPVALYSFDIAPTLFVVDETNGKLYGYNYRYEDYFFVYDLDMVANESREE